jgi:hypothetical protein
LPLPFHPRPHLHLHVCSDSYLEGTGTGTGTSITYHLSYTRTQRSIRYICPRRFGRLARSCFYPSYPAPLISISTLILVLVLVLVLVLIQAPTSTSTVHVLSHLTLVHSNSFLSLPLRPVVALLRCPRSPLELSTHVYRVLKIGLVVVSVLCVAFCRVLSPYANIV